MADKLDGVAITANSVPSNRIQTGSITSTQLQTSLYNTIVNATHPKIRSLTYPGDDTAANTGGSQTVIINGTGFGTNVAVYINGNSVPSVTVSNANSVSFSTPALSAATYPLYLINTDDGATAILIPGIQYSGTPAWVTTSPLADQTAAAAWSISLSATGDSPIVYSLQAGSSLPAGITLAANGLISGTMSSPPATDTTYNFTVVAIDPQNQDASKAFSVSVTVTIDTQFNYNVLLLHADGTNNGNNHAFLDSSNNNFAITRNGNASQGSFSPFSPTGWSAFFDGTDDKVTFTNQGTTGNFTCECWVFLTGSTVGGYHIIFGGAGQAGATNTQLYVRNAGGVGVAIGGVGVTSTTGTSVQFNAWNHVAWVRSGSTVAIFVNGNRITTGTSTDALNVDRIGSQFANYEPIGYISNARITTTAVYDVTQLTYTVPTTPLTAISGTYLLTLQNNRYVDNSASPLALTLAGTPLIQAFSPFASTTAYSTSSHGGSAYFDGNSDSLTLTSTSSLQLTGVFTIEFWMYLNTIVLDTQHPSVITFPGGWQVYVNSSSLYVALYNGAADVLASASSSITTNQWYHIAISRNASNNLSLYVNGTRVATTTNSGTIGSSSGTLRFMSFDGTGGDANGYISNLRFVNGTAVYDPTLTTLTVPTAPLSAVANTQLLLSCTNGQIFDSTTKGVLECVGDTKVNTSVYKYGTGSIFFDGTGDYLVVNAGTTNLYAFGTGDFTVEGWFYPTTNSGSSVYRALFDTLGSGAAATTAVRVYYYNNTLMFTEYTTTRISGGTPVLNAWNHFALNRTASQTKLYLNGTQVGSTYADTNSYVCGASRPTIGGSGYSVGTEMFIGNMDDIRVTKGLGRYPYNFAPPTKAFADKSGADTSTSDTYFPYTTLLLPGNGTNNANNQTFVDSSTNNFAITRNGNATQGTFSPFSQTGWSGYIDSSSQYVSYGSSADFTFGTGDFTVEAWVYVSSIASSNAFNIFNVGGASAGSYSVYVNQNGTVQSTRYGDTAGAGTTIIPIIFNSWNHIAAVRSGGTAKVYINGVADSNSSYSMGSVTASAGETGRIWQAAYTATGYVSNLRVCKGTAVYTSNFTPSTTTLTSTSQSAANCVLLTLQSNRFIDNNTTVAAKTITLSGSPSIQAFSPFSPSAVYAAANNGASAYFDGTGDYLSIANNAVFDMGSSDFTIEGWFYQTASGTYPTICGKYEAGYQASWAIGMTSTNWDVYTYYGATSFLTIYTGARPPLNTWNHFALERNGANIEFYVNGTRLAQVGAQTLRSSSSAVAIGALGAGYITGYEFPGYISNLRIVKGTAVYSGATYTVPTAPLTAITNTSLLLSATNGGIIDATGKNVLETVGDAKISTTQSKFGGSSMYFDGTGDYLVTPSIAVNTLAGDFTVEMWVYRSAGNNFFFTLGDSFGSTGFDFYIGNVGANLRLYSGNSVVIDNALSSVNFPASTWTHLAIVRFSGSVRVYVAGMQAGSAWSSTAVFSGKIYVGAEFYNGSITGTCNGYMDEVRVTNGIARYTSNFTPPASALLAK